jgi:hypothetical protein
MKKHEFRVCFKLKRIGQPQAVVRTPSALPRPTRAAVGEPAANRSRPRTRRFVETRARTSLISS